MLRHVALRSFGLRILVGKRQASRHSEVMAIRTRVVRGLAMLAFCAAAVAQQPTAVRAVNGRLEEHGGIKLLRVWGTPAERGYAHGFLLGKEVAAVAIAEFTARFARQQPLLDEARRAVGRLIEYPDDARAEIEALFEGLVASKADLQMPELERTFDLKDLLVGNALDVFGLMGCSGFTVWGEQVVGGGVLTGRNFDWPFTGKHMLEHTIIVVEHQPNGRAVASVTWPGYVGSVSGVSSEGIAAFLHVGSGRITRTPEPGSWPTAVAARAILGESKAADGVAVFAEARRLLEYTSPPAGFLTHIVLPQVPEGHAPDAVFETDSGSSVQADEPKVASVVTNHFHTRKDGRNPSKDSLDREQRVRTCIEGCLGAGDKLVSIEEAWTILASVQRGGGHAFGTLHSVVFRHEPWCFELRVAAHEDKGLVAAPKSPRRFALTQKELFATGESFGR